MGRKPKGSAKERREPAHKIDGDGMELQGTSTLPSTTAAIVVDAKGDPAREAPMSAEVDAAGRPYLASEQWKKMDGPADGGRDAAGLLDRIFTGLYGDLPSADRLRVAWLAGTLFFIIGGYWLLRSLKDPIVATIVGVTYIPKCKMLSLVVVFTLVFVYNKLVDIFPKHQLFYIIGAFYFGIFSAIAIAGSKKKKLARDEFTALHPDDSQAATRAFVAFTGLFGQVTNTISFGFSLLGTSMVIRRLGLKLTLLAFPCMCLAVVLMVMMFPQLYVVFLALILLKGFSYSLNNPCKEILYQPTNSAVKFKSKSWIDIFGARMSKAGGSLVTDAFRASIPGLIHVGGSVAAGGAAFLIWVAWMMGKKFDELMETGEIIGGDGESAPPTLEALAASEEAAEAQEAADTSCGVLEEGQADEAFLGGQPEVRQRSESKNNSVDL